SQTWAKFLASIICHKIVRINMTSIVKTISRMLRQIIENPIFVGLALSLFAVPFYAYLRTSFFHTLSFNDYDVIQSFILWFGIPYGLLIALVLINTWTQFDAVDREFSKEADTIIGFLDTLDFIQIKNKRLKQKILVILHEYIDHVRDNFQVEYYKRDISKRGELILESLQVVLVKIILGNKKEAVFFGDKLFYSYKELTDARKSRVSISRSRMPSAIWMLTLLSSILWLIPFYGLRIDNQIIGLTFTGGVTFVIISLLIIIRDLDDPFAGTWRISTDDFDELKSRIKNKFD
ncbi:MAG: DUF4239 domain-containing protein, partial [Anaerolineae bacterium]|nr:DUF4239 domain-containing protein [Anaerolineae bacterium]